MSAAVAMGLVATGHGTWSTEPEQALLGRTSARFHEVSTNKPAISAEQAFLGKVDRDGAAAPAAEARNSIAAGFALLGR